MFKLIRKDKKKGFTLVELIVVIAILAILALILVPAISNYVGEANRAKDAANAKAVYNEAMLIVTTENPALDDDTGLTSVSGLTLPSGATISYDIKDGTIENFVYTVNGEDYPVPEN